MLKKIPPPRSTNPAVSVIIPMYNVEEYIGECLESVLLQTFQDFEVIVVDDCSTDNSVAIVEKYAPKFDGRLTLTKTEKNSGGGGYLPRNIGLKMARGEYIYFLDADDFILLTALETLYTAAKEYDAEVVYMAAYYRMPKPNDIYLRRDNEWLDLLNEGKEEKPTLIINDPSELLTRLLIQDGNFHMPYQKFIRHDFLLANNLFFPNADKLTNGGDFLWTINLFACTKKFLRLPVALYFYNQYTTTSVSEIKREPQEQLSHWFFLNFVVWLKTLKDLESRIEVLRNNPAFAFAAMKSYIRRSLDRTREARAELTDQDIYEILCRGFGNKNDLLSSMLPLFVSVIDTDNKRDKSRLQTVNNLNRRLEQIKDSLVSPTPGMNVAVPKSKSGAPAISVVIPLYNAERYIGECLDSLLAQTFQDFEVIIVDDCSTDSSCAIVESYMPKFNDQRNIEFTKSGDNSFKLVESYMPKLSDQLKLYHLEKNSGGGATPRNKGAILSRGEYIKFLDADDMLTSTALAEMYSFAKAYNADFVHCVRRYIINDDGSNLSIYSDKRSLVDHPILESQDLKDRVDKVLKDAFRGATWWQFIRRSLMIDNEIFFPHIVTSEDRVWSYGLFFYAKRVLFVPNVIYIHRYSEGSVVRKERTPQEIMNLRWQAILFGVKALDELMGRHEFFKANPSYRFAVLKKFVNGEIAESFDAAKELSEEEIYWAIKDEFGDKLGDYAALIPFLCKPIYNERSHNALINRLRAFITARIDIKFMSTKGDFQILSVSDKGAKVEKPGWFQRNGIGYTIQSHAGQLNFTVKATINGKIQLNLMGLDVRSPKDRTKRVPHWIDYTKLTVNGKVLFDKINSAWHDEPCRHTINVKAKEEIKLQIEWLPHRSDVLDQKPVALPPKIENPIPDKFLPFITSRIDIKMTSTKGDFQIISVPDDKTKIFKPNWFQKDGIGYQIQSYAGQLTFTAKTTVDGKIWIGLKGLLINDPEDKTKTIPYWIDYTKLTINGKPIFDTPTPACYSKSYSYKIDAKAGEQFKIQVEWQPHRSDILQVTPPEISDEPKEVVSTPEVLPEPKDVASTPKVTSEPKDVASTPKVTSEPKDVKLTPEVSDEPKDVASTPKVTPEPKDVKPTPEVLPESKDVVSTPEVLPEPKAVKPTPKVTSEPKDVVSTPEVLPESKDVEPKIESQIPRNLNPHITARIDARFADKAAKGDFQILSISDKIASVSKPEWFQKNGVGYIIHSSSGELTLRFKVTANGRISLNLRGMDVRNSEDWSKGVTKRIPYWIDYTSLTVNDKTIFNTVKPAWCDKPYSHKIDVKAGEELTIKIAWQPHKSDK